MVAADIAAAAAEKSSNFAPTVLIVNVVGFAALLGHPRRRLAATPPSSTHALPMLPTCAPTVACALQR